MGRRYSIEQSGETATRLPPWRYALGLLTPKKDGCTMTMLLARGVKIETIDELLAAGLAIKKSELVGRGRPGRDHANCDHGRWTASARTRRGRMRVPDRAGPSMP